jgi:hypothetical protein
MSIDDSMYAGLNSTLVNSSKAVTISVVGWLRNRFEFHVK